MEILVQLHVRLLRKDTGKPFRGKPYKVRFFDRDIMNDDLLGESGLDIHGDAAIPVSKAAVRSIDSPLENLPDIWFELLEDGKRIYKSEVIRDLDPQKAGALTPGTPPRFDLGTYRI